MSQTEGESTMTASFLKPEEVEPQQQDFVPPKQKAEKNAEEQDFDEAPDDDPDDKDSDYLSVKRDITMRAIFLGLVIGTLVGAMNVNFGLKTGWTQGGSIFTAILSIGIFRVINPSEEYTKYETVITTTTASAVGSMASASGLVSYFPALKLLGRSYSVWELYLWAIGVAYIGIFFAFPLRKTMIVHEKLRFPSGTVTAETIKNMFAKGAETVQKAKSLLYTAMATALFSLAAFFVPYIEEPPMPAIVRQWGWNLNLDPLLFGGGMLSGFRASASMMLGAVVGWGILGPIANSQQWVIGKPMTYQGVRGWILWVGVAIMTADSFVQLLFSIGYAVKGLFTVLINRRKKNQGHSYSNLNTNQEDEERPLPANKKPTRVVPAWVPWYWWAIGLTISCITLLLVGQFIFDLKWYFVLLAFPISLMLSIIAVRCSGETDINPVGSMGKVTQLIYAGIAPRQIPTNLLSAGIVAAGAAQCGDMMQDLKTGYLLKVAPRSQFIAQLFGIMFGIVFCIPIYKLYDTAYHIGGEEIPAPAAHAWKAVAEVLSQGFGALPLNSGWGMLAGAIFGILLGFLYKVVSFKSEKVASFIPSALAFGMGMIVPAKQSVTMFLGSLVLLLWQRVAPQHCKRYFFTISSGLIAGEGLMGIFVAILKLIGVKPLFELPDDM